MKKYIILLLAMLNISVLSCFGASWVQIGENDYIDIDSIKVYVNDYGETKYNKYIFWVKYVGNGIYKEVENSTGKSIEYGLMQSIIDYSNNTIAAKAGITYDKEGSSVSSYSYNDYELQYNSIIPGSNAEIWANLVKKPRLLKRAYKEQQAQKRQK